MAKTAFSVGDIVLSRYLRHLSVICRHKISRIKTHSVSESPHCATNLYHLRAVVRVTPYGLSEYSSVVGSEVAADS
jgi:hypothetical protein